jgi:hypothetical protein
MRTARPPAAAAAGRGRPLGSQKDASASATVPAKSGLSVDPAGASLSCAIPFQPLEPDQPAAAASASAASTEAAARPPSYLVVEYPGMVEHAERAIEHLQGESIIQQVLTAPDPLLKLYFRPSDPTAHPLFGEVHSEYLTKPLPPSASTTARRMESSTTGAPSGEHCFEYVVKVTRTTRRKRPGEEKAPEPEVRAEFLGQVATAVAFNGLCDFQLVQHAAPEIDVDMPQFWPTAMTATSAPGHAPVPEMYLPNRPGPIILAPLLFSRYDYTREYNFANHENSNAAFRAAAFAAATKQQTGDSEDEEKMSSNAADAPSAVSKKKRGRSPTVVKSRTAPAEGAEESDEEGEDEESEAEHAGEDATTEEPTMGVVGKKKRRAPRRYFVPYGTNREEAPILHAPDPATEFAKAAFQERPAVLVLKTCFAQRPIWSADALVLRLEEEQKSAFSSAPKLSRQELLHHLVAVAYRFSGGPWRNLWIRYGYDPRDRTLAVHSKMSVEIATAARTQFLVPFEFLTVVRLNVSAGMSTGSKSSTSVSIASCMSF